jgi:hypothetical protein
MLTWQASGGFSLDASVRIHGSDSAGRERLLRYCARPPFALERLRLKSHVEAREQRGLTTSGGQAGVRQVPYHPRGPPATVPPSSPSPLEFLAALSRLIPPRRVHRHRYHGVPTPNARMRKRVIHLGRDNAAAPAGTDSGSDPFAGIVDAPAPPCAPFGRPQKWRLKFVSPTSITATRGALPNYVKAGTGDRERRERAASEPAAVVQRKAGKGTRDLRRARLRGEVLAVAVV